MDFTALHPAMPVWLSSLEARLVSLFTGEYAVLREAATTVTHAPGKRLRPLLLLLACEACGPVPARAIDYAATIELLHTASLVHDDVVDEAALRRAAPSAPARWGNKFAVLLGDYLLARLFEIGMADGDVTALRMVTDASGEMARGVLLELTALDLQATEEIYWQVVAGKTASLYAAAARLGAHLGGASAETCDAMREFGHAFGLAYQLSDDLLDYDSAAGVTGKAQGADWQQRRATLPVLHVLRTAPAEVAQRLTELWLAEELTPVHQGEVADILRQFAGFDFTWQKVKHYQACARRHLAALPAGEARAALERLCDEAFPLPVMPGS